jgi:hypothetical protein
VASQNLLTVVDDLLGLPFPDDERREGPHTSGPGHHLRVLWSSEGFGGDRDAAGEVEAERARLVDALTAGWGAAATVDLTPFRWVAGPVPEPYGRLSQLSGEMLVWQRPELGRWLGLAVGRAGAGFPRQLVAAVGHSKPA